MPVGATAVACRGSPVLASIVSPRLSSTAPLESANGIAGCSFAARDWHAFGERDALASWDALADRAAEPNPFFESWYLLPSLQAFDPRGRVKLLCLEQDGELAGLMPVCRETLYYGRPLPHWRNWTHANCFLGSPLVREGMERAFFRGLFEWCDAHRGWALFLHLTHIAGNGPLHYALKSVVAEARRPAATVLREERALLASDLSPEDYLAQSLSGKKRKELRRQQRRLGEEGEIAIERMISDYDIAAWTGEFLALERTGWKGAAGSALACDPRTEQLFRRALAGAASMGKLERLAIRLDGRPLAMLATFVANGSAYSFKTAFDERYGRFSPGVLLQRENLDVLDNPAIAFVDSCAAEDHPMIDHIWRERRPVLRHSIGIGGAARRRAFALIAARETGRPARGLE